MTATNRDTPEIHVRDWRFSREAMANRWWMAGDPIGTTFYNALSAGFPRGEAFFVEAVRHFRDDAPPKLAAEIAGFVQQEVMHSREHIAFNRRSTEAGYDMSSIDAAVEARLQRLRAMSPIAGITATMALEHLTAVVAHAVLSDPSHLARAEPEAAALWRWHAFDEIEHKGVAFDTWLHATRGMSRFKRWKIRSLMLLIVTRNVLVDRIDGSIELLRQDGFTGLGARLRLYWFLFGRPGLIRKVFPAWLSFFLPGFHPWNHDNRALLAKEREAGPLAPA